MGNNNDSDYMTIGLHAFPATRIIIVSDFHKKIFQYMNKNACAGGRAEVFSSSDCFMRMTP